MDFSRIFVALHDLMCTFDARAEGELLVHVLVLIERLARRQPGCLNAHTLQPILAITFTLAVKHYFDEEMRDVSQRLRDIGYGGMEGERLLLLESTVLSVLDWNIEVSRATYTDYVFALRQLVVGQIVQLEEIFPKIVSIAFKFDECDHERASPSSATVVLPHILDKGATSLSPHPPRDHRVRQVRGFWRPERSGNSSPFCSKTPP